MHLRSFLLKLTAVLAVGPISIFAAPAPSDPSAHLNTFIDKRHAQVCCPFRNAAAQVQSFANARSSE